jgi:hypothetical protein
MQVNATDKVATKIPKRVGSGTLAAAGDPVIASAASDIFS